jgi:hypothetical protein
MIPIVIVFGALQGMFVEWIGVRPAIKIKSEFGWIMSTIALAIIFKNVAENIWGKDDLPFPSPPSPHAVPGLRRQRAADAGAGGDRRACSSWRRSNCSTASRSMARPWWPPPTTAMRRA